MDWRDGLEGWIGVMDWRYGLKWWIGVMDQRDGSEGWIGGMDRRDGSEGWIGGMDQRDGLEGWIGGMDLRDGLEGWIGGMALRDGLEGWVKGDCRDGQRDRQIKGWRDVVLLYLFYFREKRNFRIFVKNPFSRKAKFSRFRGLFSRKTKMIFVRIFAKIYFRPNSKYAPPPPPVMGGPMGELQRAVAHLLFNGF
jgi:hypothetical protein